MTTSTCGLFLMAFLLSSSFFVAAMHKNNVNQQKDMTIKLDMSCVSKKIIIYNFIILICVAGLCTDRNLASNYVYKEATVIIIIIFVSYGKYHKSAD